MEPYDENVRRRIVRERIERLAHDYPSVPRERRRRGRLDLRQLLGVGAYRRARKAQPARS